MSRFRPSPLALLIAAALLATPAIAQHAGHDMAAMPGMGATAKEPAPAKPASKKRAAKTTRLHESTHVEPTAPGAPAASAGAHQHGGVEVSGMDHGAGHHATHASHAGASMRHGAGGDAPAEQPSRPAMHHGAASQAQDGHAMPDMSGMDMSGMHHSMMDHSTMHDSAMDHGAMDHSTMHPGSMPPAAQAHEPQGSSHDTPSMPGMDASTMDHSTLSHAASPGLTPDASPREPIPVLTDADRAAAFPTLAGGHPTHDAMTHSYWLADRLEAREGGQGGAWEGLAWIGGDIDRVWLRSEGDVEHGRVERGNLEVLYGHAVGPWWDVLAGAKHEFGEGPSRTYAAFGVQGLAPYKLEVDATAYVGNGGRTAVTLEAEYDTLITNRLVLQWQGEANVHGRSDHAIGVGSGLSTIEAGARLRYEISRRFAPYIGVEVERAFGATADLRREDGRDASDRRVVAGIRFWF